MVQHWFSYHALGGLIGSRWVSAAFATLLFTYGGRIH